MDKDIFDKFFSVYEPASKMPSAQALAHFCMKTDSNPEADQKIQNILSKETFRIKPGRKKETFGERKRIEAAADTDAIIKIMRGHTDTLNQSILINRALSYEDEIVPELIGMLKTSLNSGFIEIAARVLAKSTKDIADELIACFDEIKNPYAQSIILVVLGYKADETRVPWVISRYKELKRLYPGESYCDGAYYALFEMQSRFCH